MSAQIDAKLVKKGTFITIDGEATDIVFDEYFDVDEVLAEISAALAIEDDRASDIACWLFKLNERNIIDSCFISDVLWLRLVHELKRSKKQLTISTDSLPLFKYLKSHYNFGPGSASSTHSFLQFGLFFVRFVARVLKYLFFGLCRSFWFRFLSLQMWRRRKTVVNKKQVIVSWVTDNSIGLDGYRDLYFPDIAKGLYRRGGDPLTLFYTYGTSQRWRLINKVLKNGPADILPIEAFLTPKDYLGALFVFVRSCRLYQAAICFSWADISVLSRWHLFYEAFSEPHLVYMAMQRLTAELGDMRTIITNHENDRFEKAVIMGARKQHSSVKIIGCFHTTKPDRLIHLVPASTAEAMVAPVPDTIFFNAEKYCEAFASLGLRSKLVPGLSFKKVISASAPSKYNLLVCLPGKESAALSILSLLQKNCLRLQGFSVKVRLHPAFLVGKSLKSLLKNFDVSNQSLVDDLKWCGCLFTGYSSVAIEARCSGRFVGLYLEGNEIALNPFDNTGIDDYTSIRDSRDLTRFIDVVSRSGRKCGNVSMFCEMGEVPKTFYEECL